MRFRVFAILALLVFSSMPAYADDSWCRPNVAPKINVVPTTDNIIYDFSKSKAQLDGFDIDTKNPYGSNVITDVGGLMKGGIETKQSMSFGILENPNTKQVCMWLSEVLVTVKISPTIFIANDYPRGTCEHNAVMEHENKHVEVDRQLVNSYSQLMGQEYYRLMQQRPVYGPVPIAHKEALTQQISNESVHIFNAVVQRMEADRKAQQQQVDNLQEYERVQALCPNGLFGKK